MGVGKLLFCFFLLFIPLWLFSQINEVHQLKRTAWDNSRKNFFARKIGVRKPIEHASTPVYLSNGEKIIIYEIKDFQLYGLESDDGAKGVKLKALAGFDAIQNIVVVRTNGIEALKAKLEELY